MNLDELRTVQSKERSKDSLQHLRETFYADVADYVEDLRERRDRAAEAADNPFDDPEVNRLTDEIQTAEDVVEAVYERRVGKVVKRASLAAAGMPADEEGLTSEEQELFAELVERIEANKESVLEILAGEADGADAESTSADSASAETAATPEPGDPPAPSAEGGPSAADGSDTSATDEVSAADVMGGDPSSAPASGVGDETAGGSSDEGSRPTATEAAAVVGSSDETGGSSDSPDPGREEAGETDSGSDDVLGELAERTTIRITSDVGEIFGVDERTYDLVSEDVVTLPEANAEPLVERGAAEKLE